MSTLLRQHAEQQFAEELHELKKNETNPIPENWEMSPQSVVTYLMGGKLKNGFEVSPKYIGNRRLMEIAVATLVTDRALLLYGLPGTAKSWVSEHIAAAISGDSTLIVQGTAGTGEEAIRYGWNYARLLAEGPSEGALVQTPIMKAMQEGKIGRIEELTRIGSDVHRGADPYRFRCTRHTDHDPVGEDIAHTGTESGDPSCSWIQHHRDGQ